MGTSPYKAYAGVLTELNQVYYLEVKEKLPDGKLRVTNPFERGQKKKVKQIETLIESDLVYPLIRGRDIKKWYVEFENRYILVPHYRDGKPIPHNEMKLRYPLTWSYLLEFYNDLINRSGGFLSKKLEPYKKMPLEKAEKLTVPFYYVMNKVEATFAPYKVVWKRISGKITGKAVKFAVAVVEPYDGRPVVPDDSTILVPFEHSDEAYFVCGVLNSTIVRSIIASYTYELRQETHILDYVKLPRYNPQNPVHQEVVKLSKRAHELAKCIYAQVKPDYCKGIRNPEEELKRVEDELDKYVAKLYEIPEEALLDIKRLFAILKAEELPEEGEEELEEVRPSIEFLKTDVVAGQRDYLELNITTAGECDKAELVLEGPWGIRRVYLSEGRHRVEVSLSEGIYEARYRFVCGEHSSEGSVKVASSKSTPTGPKRPSTLRLE